MQHLSTLNKTYESGEILSSDNLNQIINYINQSINAINELMINNDISTGHYEIRYKDSLSEPSPPSTGSSGLSDGWKKSIDSAVYNIWMTQCFVTIGNTYGTWIKAIKISAKDGKDGDGIEYIFWGKSEAITDWNAFSQNSQNLVNYPPSWTNNENFQNNEYSGPNGSLWTNDSLGINDTTRKFIYMSKRKKTTNPQTGISSWEAFSIPVLWNQYTGTSFTSNIFKRSSTKPNKPGANEGSFLHPVPTGWSDGVPAGTNSIWITSRIFSSNGQYPQQEEWNDVQLMSDTESFDVEFSPIESNPGTPTTNPNNWYDPTTDTNVDWTNMIWMATRTKSNGVWGDWNITKMKGEKGEKGEKGDSGSGSSYDDTDLRTAISNLQSALSDANTTVESERDRLSGLINNLDQSIQDKIENLFDDATWIQNNFPEGSGSSSNFGQQDVENYLQTIGVWTTDGQGNTVTQWSKLSQDINGINSRVTQLEGSTSTGGDVDYNMLSSGLYNYIQNNYTTAGMESTWAKFAQLTNGDMQMLKWMSSGASSYANDATSTANLFAAAKNYSDNGNTISQAVSNINALVERDQNDNLVAKSAMESMVDNAITGIINTATSSQVGTTIFSKVNQNSDDIAAITTKITGDTSSASVDTKLGNMSAGLITTATLDSAAASLISGSENTSLKSAIMTKVSDGITSAQLVAASDYNAASIVAMVNASNDSSIKLSADKITLDGQTVAGSIAATDITLTGHVSANDFQAGPSNQLNIKTTGDKICFCDGSTAKAWFVLDGNGFQLHIIDNNGDERVIKWSSWDSTTPTYQPLSYYYKSSENNPSSAFSAAQLYAKQGNYYEYNSSTGNYDLITSGTFYTKDVLSVLPAISESEYNYPTLYRMAAMSGNSYYEPCNSQTPTQAGQPGYNGNMMYSLGYAVDPSYIDVYTEYTITSNSITATGYTVSIARQLPTAGSTMSMGNNNISFVIPGPSAIAQQSSPSIDHARTVRTPINTVSSVSSARTTSSFVAEEGNNNGTYIDIDGNSQTA